MAGTARNTLNGIAPWFGAKRAMASQIVEELGPHRSYWEPFCGSCAVLLAKPPSSMETVCDLHGDLTNLAMVLASDRWTNLHERMSRTVLSEAIFRQCHAEAIGTVPTDLPASVTAIQDRHIERAWAYLVASWAGRNGMAGMPRYNAQISVRYTANGGSSSGRFRNVADSIPTWHERLRNVLILNRDAFDVISRIDDAEGTVIYVDPPYLVESRGTGRQSGRTGGSRYLHDFEDADHERLAELLGRFNLTRVVVSYYDHPHLADLYPDWTVRRVYRQKNLHSASKRGKRKCTAPEVLLINGLSMAEPKPEPSESQPLFGANPQ